MNRAIITGYVMDDPTMTTPGGTTNAKFRLKVRRKFKNQQTGKYENDFINCVCWRQTAEYVGKYIKANSMVCVEGSIQTRDYTNKDGQKVYATEIIVDNVENLTPREQPAQQVDAQTGFPVVPPDDEPLPF